MSKISQEFLDEIEKQFDEQYKKSSKIKKLVNKLENGTVTSEEIFEYSKEVGNLRKNILHYAIQDNILEGNGTIDYQDAKNIFDQSLYRDYSLINTYCGEGFTVVNRNNGVNLNGVNIAYNQGKTDGITKVATSKAYNEVREEVEEAIKPTPNHTMIKR